MSQFQGTVAFITGGNRGIGLETARELGQRGIKVVIGVRDLPRGEAAVAELKRQNIEAEAIHYDASQADSIAGVVTHLQQHYGKLDILVNNAGVLRETLIGGNQSSSVSPAVLRETFEINFFAVIELTQALLPLIRLSPAGRIVNLSSILASLTLHSQEDSPIAQAKSVAYNASKTALNAYTVHLADELKGSGIKVNAAHPGWVKTDLGGENAPMEVEGSGKTSVQLATLDANGATGGFFHDGQGLPW